MSLDAWIVTLMFAAVIGAYLLTWLTQAIANRRLTTHHFDAMWHDTPDDERTPVWESVVRDELLRQASERRTWR